MELRCFFLDFLKQRSIDLFCFFLSNGEFLAEFEGFLCVFEKSLALSFGEEFAAIQDNEIREFNLVETQLLQ